MPFTSLKSFQTGMTNLLSRVFEGVPIEKEWTAIRNVPGLYSPRIDIAVGPFSTERGRNKIAEYNEMFNAYDTLIDGLIQYHMITFRNYQDDRLQDTIRHSFPTATSLCRFNQNARCFIAVEIENQVTRKHLLGGTVNASVLSRIGILVPWAIEKARAMIRLMQYWDFLRYVEKNTFNAENVLVIMPTQLEEALANI